MGLLLQLEQLSRRILSRLWTQRLEQGRRRHNDGGGVDLSGMLEEYVQRMLVESDGQAAVGSDAGAEDRGAGGYTRAAGQRSRGSVVGTYQELSSHLKRKRRSRSVKPQLAEQFRDRTWKHIHEAASYAREGNGEAAKVHAELANRSLEEAFRFMPADEFASFRQDVERVLQQRHHAV